jgi:glycosyltransferase involved in cell wall biosynthesis
MKGPFDWIETMSQLQSMGVDFSAAWLGDGPLLEEARKQLKLKNLDGKVNFYGHQGQKDKLLKSIRESDIFVFCHKTPESPRCLIEAMLSGTPIMGYKSPYPEDLLKNISRELLTDKNDIAALTKNIRRLNENREELAKAMAYCHQISEHYTDKAVFEHRSQLIKKYLKTST